MIENNKRDMSDKVIDAFNKIEKINDNVTPKKIKSLAYLLLAVMIIIAIIYTSCICLKPFLKAGTVVYTAVVAIVDTGEWIVDTIFGIKTKERKEIIDIPNPIKEKQDASNSIKPPETKVTVKTDSKTIITAEKIANFISNHRAEIDKLISGYQNEANDRIFNKAIENSKKFAEDYYNERHNTEYIKEKMSIELIDQKDLDDYIFVTSSEINREILKMILLCLKENGINVQEIEIQNSSYEVLQKYLPNAKEMIDQIYADLEKAGANNIPRSYLNQKYQELSNNHPNIKTITLTAYVVIAGTLLAKSKFPIAATVGSVTILSWLGYNELDLSKGKNDFYQLLRDSMIKRKGEYMDILKNVVNKIFEGAFLGLSKAEYIRTINDSIIKLTVDKNDGYINIKEGVNK